MKVLKHGTSVLNRKANTDFVNADMGTSSASVAKKNADSSREVEIVFSGHCIGSACFVLYNEFVWLRYYRKTKGEKS